MQIPRTLVDNYTRCINGLTRSAQLGVSRAMERFEFSGDVAADRDRIISIMSASLRPYLSNSVAVAAAFYDIVREIEIGEKLGERVELNDVYDAAKTEEAVRAFMQNEVDGSAEKIAPLLLERVDYEMKLAAAMTGYVLGERDTERPKWARVPSGTETCEFCLALAGLGAHYSTRDSADFHIHSGCDCRVVPRFGKATVEGYNPSMYRERFKESVQARADRMGITYEDAYESRYGTEARMRRARAAIEQ